MATAALSPSEARQVKFTVPVILRCAILTHGSRVEVRTQLTPLPRAASEEIGAPECNEDQRAGRKA